MNADDLKRMKKDHWMHGMDDLLQIIFEKDEQIAAFQEHENQTHKILGNILGKDTSLEAGARRAMEQITTLKAALCKERNRYLVDFIYEYDDIQDCEPEAKEQLARELPEIDWEDKQ